MEKPQLLWNDVGFFRNSVSKSSDLIVLFFFKEREVLDVKAGLAPPGFITLWIV